MVVLRQTLCYKRVLEDKKSPWSTRCSEHHTLGEVQSTTCKHSLAMMVYLPEVDPSKSDGKSVHMGSPKSPLRQGSSKSNQYSSDSENLVQIRSYLFDFLMKPFKSATVNTVDDCLSLYPYVILLPERRDIFFRKFACCSTLHCQTGIVLR